VLRRSASMLRALVAEITVVGCRVRDVPRPGVVNDRFPDLCEARREAVNEHEDEEDAHERRILAYEEMAGMALDVTERKRREINQAFLAALADDFARLATEQEITKAIGARLVAHLDITTCSIADFAGGMATVRSAFTRSGAVEAATTLKVSDYLDEDLQAAASAGQTIVIRDMRKDPRVHAIRNEALGVRSGIIVPFLVARKWRHSFAVGTHLGLPDIDGYEVVRILRGDEALRSIRFIALSGYAQPEDIERAREAGFRGAPPEAGAARGSRRPAGLTRRHDSAFRIGWGLSETTRSARPPRLLAHRGPALGRGAISGAVNVTNGFAAGVQVELGEPGSTGDGPGFP
jgi:CheY-like chemotaxis protein/Arc/MetJ-type ribon-helix-helix transcriptional regulator